MHLKRVDEHWTQCVSPAKTQLPQSFLLVPLNQLNSGGFFPPHKKSTVYLNRIPVKISLQLKWNAEVAVRNNSWRTLVFCLSFSLLRVETPLFRTGSSHTLHTAQYENAGMSGTRCRGLERVWGGFFKNTELQICVPLWVSDSPPAPHHQCSSKVRGTHPELTNTHSLPESFLITQEEGGESFIFSKLLFKTLTSQGFGWPRFSNNLFWPNFMVGYLKRPPFKFLKKKKKKTWNCQEKKKSLLSLNCPE